MPICDKSTMRTLNTLQLLRRLLEHGPMSQKDLQQILGFKKATVCVLINQLKQQGFIGEGEYGQATSRGGRRPLALSLNRQKIVALGTALRGLKLRSSLTDLNGAIRWSGTFDVSSNSPTEWAPHMLRQIDFIHTYCQEQDLILLGAGLSLGCVYDPAADMLNNITSTPERDISVNDLIRQHTETAFHIDDYPNAMALGEMWFGRAQKLRNFLYLQRVNPRLTIVINGVLYRGTRVMAGEIGNLRVGKSRMSELLGDDQLFMREAFKNWLLNLSCLFDPEKIILTPWEKGRANMDSFDTHVVETGKLKTEDAPLGAAAMVFHNFFKGPQI